MYPYKKEAKPKNPTISDSLAVIDPIYKGCVDNKPQYYCNTYKFYCNKNKFIDRHCAKTCQSEYCEFVEIDGEVGIEDNQNIDQIDQINSPLPSDIQKEIQTMVTTQEFQHEVFDMIGQLESQLKSMSSPTPLEEEIKELREAELRLMEEVDETDKHVLG